MKLVFLGKFRVPAGDGFQTDLPAGVATLAELKEWLTRRDPDFGEMLAATPAQVVVNHEIVRDMSFAIADGDEIAFLPPMSGG